MKNRQKGFSTILRIVLVLTLLGGGFYLFAQIVDTKEDYGTNEATVETIVSESGIDKEDETQNILGKSAIEVAIDEIFEEIRSEGIIANLREYFVSPDKKHLFIGYFGKHSIHYFFYNLDTQTKIDLGRNEYYNTGDFAADILWAEDSSYAVLVSSWGSEGGDAFTGILKVDLKSGKLTRLIDKNSECNLEYECFVKYGYLLEKIENGTLFYTERVYKVYPTYVDYESYTDERKSLIIN